MFSKIHYILLPGSGCEWARKKHKGCSFCAFNAAIDEVTGGRLITFDEMMEFFKSAASKVAGSAPELLALFNGGNFINDKGFLKQKFNWQDGYGAFSYSQSNFGNVVDYIKNQKEHHKKKTFQEEYRGFLKKFNIPFEDKYLFDFYD